MKYLLMLLLAGCLSPRSVWTVEGGTKEQHEQAYSMVNVASRLTGHPERMDRGYIHLCSDKPCIIKSCGSLMAGCIYPEPTNSIAVITEPPRGPDLKLSALAHELCHMATWNYANLDSIEACALLVNQGTYP